MPAKKELKTVLLSLRVTPSTAAALEKIRKKHNRSINNMIESLILDTEKKERRRV